jgi:multicomponent Na+:H+ antiporter subunit D
MNSYLPALAVLIPVIAAPLAVLLRDQASNRFTAWVNVLSFITVAAMYPRISQGQVLETIIDTGLKIKFSFMADALSVLSGLIFISLWMLASFYSIEYMSHEHEQRRYNLFSLLSLAGTLGVAFTRNLFTLYLFFELLSVASYVMVIHEQTNDALTAGVKYLFMGVGGGLILLFSIIATYTITGTGDLIKISRGGLGLGQHPYMPLIFMGYVIGFGVKAGIFPVHIWLPDAHPIAPSPASALLSGVMIKAGAYGIVRAAYTIVGLGALRHQMIMLVVMIFAFINIFLGSAMAMKQRDIKRMLAYSSISQIGYIIMGIALLTPKGIIGGVVHIFNHAIIKGTLFLCAGAFIHQTGLRQLDELEGIGKRMPLTTICFSIAALSMIGLPPFNGFISKWYLALGTLEAVKLGSYKTLIGVLALGILLLSSLMNLMYYGPIIYRAWFDEVKENHAGADQHNHEANAVAVPNDDPNPYMMLPLLLLAGGAIFFGIFPQLPVDLARQLSQAIFY